MSLVHHDRLSYLFVYTWCVILCHYGVCSVLFYVSCTQLLIYTFWLHGWLFHVISASLVIHNLTCSRLVIIHVGSARLVLYTFFVYLIDYLCCQSTIASLPLFRLKDSNGESCCPYRFSCLIAGNPAVYTCLAGL